MAYYPQNYGFYGNYPPAVPDTLNQFKSAYQMPQQPPQQHQMQPQATVQNSQPTNDMIWVLGEVEATGYPVAPNNTVTLWDRDKNTVYLKSVNAQGVPSMRILDYTERTAQSTTANNQPLTDTQDFVKTEQLEALQDEIDTLKKRIEELTAKKPTTKKAKENE